ncbi:MAG: DUF3524 domain-containing protein [Actinomycetia bacterium]|nr:DUF3524 domain-containing protein [Actinomycetes bacterium]
MSVDVLLVVPWYGGSHRGWADGWQAHSRHEITLVTTPPERWRHHMLAGTAELAGMVREQIATAGRPDVLVVSSLTDVAALVGLCRHSIGDIAVVAYQHESQLLHPSHRDNNHALVEIEWRSLAAADRVWFNSEYHLGRYLATCPHPTRILAERSTVLPVGVDLSDIGLWLRPSPRRPGPTRLIFNQRWDADKRPERVVAALANAAAAGADFEIALAGGQPAHDLRALNRACERLGSRVIHAGYADRATYLDLLHNSDAVVGDPAHEFFGVAAVEAMAAGCTPLLPRDLSYPELVGDKSHLLHESHDLIPRLIDLCSEAVSEPSQDLAELAREVRRFEWARIAPMYDTALAELAR